MAASLAKSTEHTPILLKFLLLIILLSYVTKSYPSAHHNKTTLIGTGLKVFPPRNFSFGSTINISLNEKPNTSRQRKCLMTLLILLSGDIESNPGPGNKSIFPCGLCDDPVNRSQKRRMLQQLQYLVSQIM
ncbi:hypothetical protein DPMN_100264 [Dreissena polymorpha]|uniref:Transmembrane protein n=1 Tax=Dreissena polymorpha TaxID=45954 RepID=A0A9D4R821_DREPO|nr:hypothetical protein DPMN_100264 [Dreissena polymorpha]